MKKLSDAEFEIMNVIWKANGKLTSNQILEEMGNERNWKLASLMTVLSRMAEKGYVHCDRSTRTNYYTALISEEDYKLQESTGLLDRLYDNSVQKMVAGLYKGKKVSNKDLEELKDFLNSVEPKEK